MSDFIEIEDLLLRTYVGINPEEQAHRQDVVLNIRLHFNCRPAGESDDIEQTVNYRTVTKAVIQAVETQRFQLVESLAERAASICLQADRRIDRVIVKAMKPGALRFARAVGVTIERTQSRD